MAAMRSLMVASSVAFALACQDVNGFDQAPTNPTSRMSDSRILAVACSRMCPGAPIRIPQPR